MPAKGGPWQKPTVWVQRSPRAFRKILFQKTSLLGPRFYWCLMVSGSLLGFNFDDFDFFCITFSSMDFALICHGFCHGFQPDFFMIFRSRAHLAKPSKTMTLTAHLLVFTFQKNHICCDSPHLCRYQFLHWFLMCFCIDVTSLLAAFWYQFSCFWVIDFWMIFWMVNL